MYEFLSCAVSCLSAVLPLAGATVAPLQALEFGAPELEESRPHIVVFMIDDLGWRDLGPAAWSPLMEAQNQAGEEASSARHFLTPHIDRLAAEGVRFAEAYAAGPVCTPTRTSLMLGQSPARTGITYWTKVKDRDQSAPFPARSPVLAAPPWRLNGIQPGTPTLASRLAAGGYHTIHVGKAHFGTGEGGDPARLGFDVNIAGWAAGAPGSYYAADGFSGAGRKARVKGEPQPAYSQGTWGVPGLDAYHGQDRFLTEVLAEEAEDALRAAVAEERRVFLHFAPYAVHTPIMVNERLRHRFPNLKGPELAYATLVAGVDDAVGRLLDTLEDLGIEDETLVVFTSDNGALSAHGRGGPRHSHTAPLRSGKGSAYEGGIRVPLIVRWPGHTAAGRFISGPVITQDLFPTLLGAANVEHGDAGATGLDLGWVLDGGDVPEARALLWHQPHYWGIAGPGIEPYSALRLGRWKLLYFHSSPVVVDGVEVRHAVPRMELYDLHTDIGENHDLAGLQPGVVTALAEQLSVHLEASGAGMSIVVESGEPVPLPRVVAR